MPEAETESATLFDLLNEVAIIAQLSARLFERRLPEGFLVSHFAVLNHLTRVGDGRTPLEIARALQVPKTSLTHTLAGLSKARLIAHAPNPKDSRSKCVFRTEAGRSFHAASIAALGPDLAAMAGAVPVDRAAEALPLLNALRTYLDAERDGV